MNKHIIYILLLTAVTTSWSCSGWLDVKPKGDTEREEFYNSEYGFRKALTGCYMKLKDNELYGLKMTTTTVDYLAQHWLAENDKDKALLSLDMSNQMVRDEFEGIYKKQYNLIVQVNDILRYIDKNGSVISDSKIRDMITGEAYALRAFSHFDILRLFGELPSGATINVSLPYAEEMTIAQIPYYTFDEFTKKVLSDLMKAEALLKNSDPVLTYGFEALNNPNTLISSGVISDDYCAYRKLRMNYYAVRAMIARVYLYMGDKSNAKLYAESVINAKNSSGTAVIALSSQEIGNGYYTMPSEQLFNLHIYNISDYMNILFRNVKHLMASPMRSDALVLKDLFDGKSTDRRYPLWYSQKSQNGTTQLTLKKYWQPDMLANAGVSHQIMPLIRLSELYLIAIECAPTLVNANQLMREFKTQRGYGANDYIDVASPEAMRTELLNEYRREFWAEGQMFFAYKRMGESTMKWRTAKVAEMQFIAPLPNTEMKK